MNERASWEIRDPVFLEKRWDESGLTKMAAVAVSSTTDWRGANPDQCFREKEDL